MKKLLILTLSLFLVDTAQAATNVNIIWAFAPSVSASNYARHVIQKANAEQNKYEFTLEFKPGATGAIAAKEVLNRNKAGQLSVLFTTNAFFVRPNLYRDQLYSTDDFRFFLGQAELPIGLVVKKGNNYQSIIEKQNINVGMAGLGSSTHIMAEQLKSMYPGVNLAPYHGTREGVRDTIVGVVDLSFDLLSSIAEDPKVEIVGVTGSHQVKDYKLLTSFGPGYSNFKNLSLMVFMLMPATTPDPVIAELHDILAEAQRNNPALQKSISADYGQPYHFNLSAGQLWYNQQVSEHKKVTSTIKKID